MGWNYLSIPKLQQGTRWSLMEKWIHHTLYNGCNDLSMHGLNLIYVSKRSLWTYTLRYAYFCVSIYILTVFFRVSSLVLGQSCERSSTGLKNIPDSKVHGSKCRPQMGPMLGPWTLLSGMVSRISCTSKTECSITDTTVCIFHWIYYLINVSVNMTLQC